MARAGSPKVSARAPRLHLVAARRDVVHGQGFFCRLSPHGTEAALKEAPANAEVSIAPNRSVTMADLKHTPALPRLRAAGPQGHRTAASLLRLSQPTTGRLPSGAALTGWLRRAAVPLAEAP